MRVHGLMILVLSLLCGCFGTVHLPSPPADADLVNDGTLVDQTRVYQRYAVGMTPGEIGVGAAVYNRHWLPGYVGFPPSMNAYLASDAEAGAALPPPWKSALPFLSLPIMSVAFGAGLLVEAGAVLLVAGPAYAVWSGAPGAILAQPTPVLVGLAIAAACAVLLVHLVVMIAQSVLVGGGLALSVATAIPGIQSEMAAVETYNRNLWTRVQRQSRKQRVVPPH